MYAGLKASGVNPDTGLVEIVEIEDHPSSLVQYHPEYKRVANPHPFCEFCSRRSKAKKIISVHQKIVKSNFLFIGKR
jgi:CTP synthase